MGVGGGFLTVTSFKCSTPSAVFKVFVAKVDVISTVLVLKFMISPL
jgi:hypothetical protein